MAVARLRNFDPFPGRHIDAARLFCFHGENDGLIRERMSALANAFAASGPPPALIDLDGDLLAREPFALADEIGSMSLFAERRFLRVTLGAKGVVDAFSNALPRLGSADGVLVAVDAGADKRQEDLLRLLGTNSAALVVACGPDTPADLANHAQSVLAEAGVTLDLAAARDLVELVDGNRALLRNELVKLALLTAAGATVDSPTMRAVVADDASLLLDDAAERVLAGDVVGTLEATDNAASAGAGPVQLAGAALRRALWMNRNASGTRAADLRRVIARLNDAILADRSSSKTAGANADLTLIRAAQFLKRGGRSR